MVGTSRVYPRADRTCLALSFLLWHGLLGTGAAADDRARTETSVETAVPVAFAVPESPSEVTHIEKTVPLSEAPAPGTRIVVRVKGAEAAGTTCSWKQVDGPPVEIPDPAATNLELIVPDLARNLGFLVTLKSESGERVIRIQIPVRQNLEKTNRLQADPGGDQLGLVGQRITLNGIESTPVGKVGFRWIQVDGPRVQKPIQDRGYYSFIPPSAGVYRFQLLVAEQSQISEPAEVKVVVGLPPLSRPESTGAQAGSRTALDRLSVLALSTLDHNLLGRVSQSLDEIADRSSLYTTFGDAGTEMMRRFDAIVPADPGTRQVWTQVLFQPLSQLLTMEMLNTGLDLRTPGAANQTLSTAQRDQLQRSFRAYAEALGVNAELR